MHRFLCSIVMKKVMVVIPALGSGGGERLAVSIIAAMDPQKIKTKLVVLYPYQKTDNAKLIEEKGIDAVYLGKKRGIDLSIIPSLRQQVKSFKPDVIQTHLYVVGYVLLASPRQIIKYHTVHNVAEKEATGLRRIINRIAFRYGNFVPVAISPYCAKTIEKVYRIKRNHFPCIVNGVDTDLYKAKHEPHDGVVFINVGRLQSQKNQKLLIKAFAKVYFKNINTKLVIIGEGELREELENLIKHLRIEKAVFMPGQSSDVAQLLNKADVFVMSSDFEGLPISVLEAMACGLPIVSTKAGGTVDIVQNEINGFLVNVGDINELSNKMLIISKNAVLREKMGLESRKLAEKYSIRKCAEEYQDLYLKS